jgi:WD40 repeat protein
MRWLCLMMMVGCGASAPHPAETPANPADMSPPPEVRVEPSVEPSVEQPNTPPQPSPPPPTVFDASSSYGYAPLWKARDSGGWNHALAITPAGDVASLSAFHLGILARHDGSQRDSVRVCDGIALRHESLFFRKDGVAIVVCRDAIHEVTLSSMSKRLVVTLPWTSMKDEADSCTFGTGKMAIGNRRGKVLEFDTQSWKRLASHDFGADNRIDAVAYSPNGKQLAVSVEPHNMSDDGRVLIVDANGKRRVPNFSDDSGALTFSPDGSELFGSPRVFTVARGSLKSGTLRGKHRVSSWLSAAVFVDDDLIAATGAHGLALLHVDEPQPIELDGDTGEGIALSPDRKLLCAGTRDGTIRCWARGKIAKSSYVPTRAAGPAPPGGNTSGSNSSATLSRRSGNQLVLATQGAPAWAVGDKAELSKKIDKQLGGLSFSAWLTVADVTVTAVGGQSMTVVVTANKSVITMNGKPVDHFTPGSKLRLKKP